MRGTKGFAKAVKSVILKTAEKKYKPVDVSANSAYDVTFGGNALNHNSIVEQTLINNISPNTTYQLCMNQGDSDAARNGDEIYTKGIMIRSGIVVPADRKNAVFKMFLVEYNSVQGDPTIFNDIFHPGNTGKVILDAVQTDRWNLKLLGTYRYRAHDTSSDLVTGQRGEILIKKWIPWRRKLCYKADDSLVVAKGMKERLSILIMSYDNNSAFDTTTVGYIRTNATLYYADP